MTEQELIEMAARAMYNEYIAGVESLEPKWDGLPADHRDRMAHSFQVGLAAIRPHIEAEVRSACERVARAEDERMQDMHDLCEEIREIIRLQIDVEDRPPQLFTKIQDLLYGFRGRTLMETAIRQASGEDR